MAKVFPTCFGATFAAVFVLIYWLREFPLSAVNRFELRCQLKKLLLLYYKIDPCLSNQISLLEPGFHMIETVGDASPRQARGHIGDDFVKWKHFLNDVADVADQTGTVRGRIERVEMSLKRGFHMIITAIVSICRRLIGDTSPKRRRLLQ